MKSIHCAVKSLARLVLGSRGNHEKREQDDLYLGVSSGSNLRVGPFDDGIPDRVQSIDVDVHGCYQFLEMTLLFVARER
jgi:hypothetical protein